MIKMLLSMSLAALVGLVLTTFFGHSNLPPQWANWVFWSIIGAGTLSAIITAESVCNFCNLVHRWVPSICGCKAQTQ